MSWFLEMKERYAPNMAPKDFNDLMNKIEVKLFNEHPEYLELEEKEQNKHVEEAVRRYIQ